MKKEVKGSSIIVLSCSESSSDESDKEILVENTEETDKEELKNIFSLMVIN